MVMTPQILYNLLSHAIFPGGISAADIICFDEAHHCKKKHPYNMIMQFYKDVKKAGGESAACSSTKFTYSYRAFTKPWVFQYFLTISLPPCRCVASDLWHERRSRVHRQKRHRLARQSEGA